jgi:DNA transformation protein and related proteins
MTRLEDLPNVGTKLAAALREAGIPDAAALTEVGDVEAWRRVHPTFDCLHSLQALAGAVRGVPKSTLDAATRAELLAIWRADQG